jgi:hypothetical protein
MGKGPNIEQLRMRELVESLKREEMPLESHDLIRLMPFVQKVREEIKEDNSTPGKRRMYRVDYYMLNERGLKLLQKWEWGMLDKLVKDDEEKPRGSS